MPSRSAAADRRGCRTTRPGGVCRMPRPWWPRRERVDPDGTAARTVTATHYGVGGAVVVVVDSFAVMPVVGAGATVVVVDSRAVMPVVDDGGAVVVVDSWAVIPGVDVVVVDNFAGITGTGRT